MTKTKFVQELRASYNKCNQLWKEIIDNIKVWRAWMIWRWSMVLYISKKIQDTKDKRCFEVKDDYHYNGKYRGAEHSIYIFQ